MIDTDAEQRAPYFAADGWQLLEPHPLAGALTNAEDWATAMARCGWREFARVGSASLDGTGNGSPLHLLVFHRPHADEEGPRFFIEVSGNISDTDEHVFVEDLPSLMTLLGSWGPALQATTLTHQAAGRQ